MLCLSLKNCNRSGADKVSIGSDAVDVAEEYIRTGVRSGQSSIEQISEVYGRQAVVVSIDPKRVYVADPSQVRHRCTSGLCMCPVKAVTLSTER